MRGQGEAADGGADEFELGGDGEIEDAESEIETEGPPDGGEDDAGQGGPDETGDAEPEREEAPQVGRGESRYQRAIREAREAREEARQLRTEFERSRQQPQQQPDPNAAARAEQEFMERIRLMDPADALVAVRDRERQMMSQALMQIEGRSIDRADKATWDAEARRDAARNRLAPDVERYIQNARAMGNWQITRENVFHLLYGQEMDRRRREVAPRQQRAAQRRVAAQTTQPGRGRGEPGRADRRPADQDAADEALLRGIAVGDI